MQDRDFGSPSPETIEKIRQDMLDTIRKDLGVSADAPVELIGIFDVNTTTGEVKPVPASNTPAPGRVQSPLNRALTNPKAVTIFRQIQAMVDGDPRYAGGLEVDCILPDVADLLTVALYWAQKHADIKHDGIPWYYCTDALAWVDRACALYQTALKNEFGE